MIIYNQCRRSSRDFLAHRFLTPGILILVLYVLILAGGLGKRMKSTLPKVLHKLLDKPMFPLPHEIVDKIDSYL